MNNDANADTNWTYQVIIDPTFENGDFGHAILQITSPSGEKLAAGFYPSRSPDSINIPDFTGIHHAVEAPGHVRYENEEVVYPEYTFKSKPRIIKEETANEMMAYISDRIDNPGRYEVWNHNCVDFVERAMVIAGDRLAIQDAKTPFMLMRNIKTQEAAEELIGSMRRALTENVKDIDGEVNLDLLAVVRKYIEDKEIISSAEAKPEVLAAGVSRLTENYTKYIGEYGLHALALKLKGHEGSVVEAGEAIGGRGY